jgi:hypothetical protein
MIHFSLTSTRPHGHNAFENGLPEGSETVDLDE